MFIKRIGKYGIIFRNVLKGFYWLNLGYLYKKNEGIKEF